MSRAHTKYHVLVPMLLVPLLALAQSSSVPPQPMSLDGATAHVYKSIGGSELRLHVFTPDSPSGSVQRPAIVFFFGGGWKEGPVNHFVPQAKHLAERGMVAIVADYRVFGRYGTSPFEAMADAKSAVRWVRAHSTELGIDPERIVAAGGSSGGHIALSAAVFDRFDEATEDENVSSKPNALVLFNPVVDTTRTTNALLKERFGERGREGSPLHHLDSLPPTIILHGKADAVVPYADVRRFCSEAKSRGNDCLLVGYDDAPHGFFTPGPAEGKWYRETLLEADRFLTRLGYLSAQGADTNP